MALRDKAPEFYSIGLSLAFVNQDPGFHETAFLLEISASIWNPASGHPTSLLMCLFLVSYLVLYCLCVLSWWKSSVQTVCQGPWLHFALPLWCRMNLSNWTFSQDLYYWPCGMPHPELRATCWPWSIQESRAHWNSLRFGHAYKFSLF